MSEFRWRCLGADQAPVTDAPDPVFPTQADAETWLGETWADLADAGVSAVTLLEHESVVYGPMSLDPPT